MTYITSIERRALAKERQEGRLEELKHILPLLLEAKFGPLSPRTRAALDSWSYEKLKQITTTFNQAKSLQELGLDG